jgi:hypothetical protein
MIKYGKFGTFSSKPVKYYVSPSAMGCFGHEPVFSFVNGSEIFDRRGSRVCAKQEKSFTESSSTLPE